jgi:hypothetical protein
VSEATDRAVEVALEEDVVRRLTLRAAVTGLDEWGREFAALRFGAVHRTLSRLRELLESDEPAAGVQRGERAREVSGSSPVFGLDTRTEVDR